MFRVTRVQLEKMPKGTVFCDAEGGEWEVKDEGSFGATCLFPHNGEEWYFDENLEEYGPAHEFDILDNNDILQIIHLLTMGIDMEGKLNDPEYTSYKDIKGDGE